MKTLKQENEDFLQSREWADFQKEAGNMVFSVSGSDFSLNVIEYKLSIVGRYLYVPRGDFSNKYDLERVADLAKKRNVAWVRIDVFDKRMHELIYALKLKIKKSPHDVQPRQVFKIDISGSEDDILTEMKQKTRYNIRLALKKDVKVKIGKDYIEDFLKLVQLTSKRKEITSHPDDYYRKMINLPSVKLYAAEFRGKIVAANIVSFYGKVATYLHGSSDNQYRNAMAPFLLQWQSILDAKKEGCTIYDFGGVSTDGKNKKWEGITRFKLGFSKNTKPFNYLGSYDIVINPARYAAYRILQGIKSKL